MGNAHDCAGLLLYAADLALRGVQMNNITTVTAATIDDASGTATLLIPADKAREANASRRGVSRLAARSRHCASRAQALPRLVLHACSHVFPARSLHLPTAIPTAGTEAPPALRGVAAGPVSLTLAVAPFQARRVSL